MNLGNVDCRPDYSERGSTSAPAYIHVIGT